MTRPKNFRDFGGVPVADSDKIVVQDQLFRSAQLTAQNEGADDCRSARDWSLIVDLRYPGERERNPSNWPETYSDRVVLLTEGTRSDAPHVELFEAAKRGSGNIDDAYIAFYRALPFDHLYRPFFGEALRRIAHSNGAVLIHCAAGKDRTGILVAMLLDLLGVAREDIVTDFMRSADLGAIGTRIDPEVMEHGPEGSGSSGAGRSDLYGVKPSYILEMFDGVTEACGSIPDYLLETGFRQTDFDLLCTRLTRRHEQE